MTIESEGGPDFQPGGEVPGGRTAVTDWYGASQRLGPSTWKAGAEGAGVVVRRIPGLAGAGVAEALTAMAGQVSHLPTVVAPLAVYEEGTSVVIVRPWVDGVPLGGERDRDLPAAERVAHSTALARALDSLQNDLLGASCPHGAIKGSNVLVRTDGTLALVDLGLSAASDGISAEDTARADVEGFARLRRSLGATLPHRGPVRAGRAAHRLGAPLLLAAVLAAGLAVGVRSHPGASPTCGHLRGPATTVPGLGGRCQAVVSWSSGTGHLWWAGGSVQFTAGRTGDELLVGRWTCRAAALPAVYRPSTGWVWIFPAWPTTGEVHSLPARYVGSAPSGGRARPVHVVSSGGCDKVRVG
ncbi:MAG TPA: hypothetical protein VFP54_08475 [Acidimicrobiales bacterium]|nr:hypothetical protein [Acidimicrobiales bacterium]